MATALITGASRGLGRALAAGMARAGWSLVIDGRDATALGRAEAALRPLLRPGTSLVAIAGDVADPAHRDALAAAVERLGGLDVLVNNASTLGPSGPAAEPPGAGWQSPALPPLHEYPIDELRRVLEVNTVAPLALVQALWPWLSRSPRPRVVNVTSDAAVESYPGWGGYGMAKAALEHQSDVLAVEEGELRVWTVDPGDMRTQMHQEAFPGEDISDRPEPESVVPALVALLESQRPSGRVLLTELAGAGSAA